MKTTMNLFLTIGLIACTLTFSSCNNDDNYEIVKRPTALVTVYPNGSEVLCSGKNASATISQAFNVGTTDDSVYLDGVVSRKKQMLPAIMEALQQ